MMQDGFDLSVIVFLGLAAFVGWRLYSVLGTRTDSDAERAALRFRPVQPAKPDLDQKAPPPEIIEGEAKPVEDPQRWRGIAEPGSSLERGLDQIVAQEPSFDAKHFLSGARAAYEAIVLAFASGDRATLKDLLSRDVFESFGAAIAERENRGQTVETTFVGLDKVTITEAFVRGQTVQLTVRFLSKLITATKDAEGKVIEGAADKITDVNDVWTFAREIGSRDPVWKLVATEMAQ